MQATRSRPGIRRGGILYLSVDELLPSPVQPRRNFDDGALAELCESIRNYGILNPLTVRLRGGRYELVAGERRLRAAKMAGLREVPCLPVDVNMEDASLLALVENLQRQDLDFIEEAAGIRQLILLFGMSQEEAARRLGKSQSAVANKLRLLRLPPDVLDALKDNGLSERHGRALLRLPDADRQREALRVIIARGLSVAAADAYVESLLSDAGAAQKEPPRRSLVLKDVRIFLNTLNRSVEVMKQGGIEADVKRQETPEALILTISIPKVKEPA